MRTRVVAIVVVGALAAAVSLSADAAPALANTCADYPNQAAAQRAAGTRDADGDGIYCEDLPCPCLRPVQGGSGSGPARRPRLGPSVNLGPAHRLPRARPPA